METTVSQNMPGEVLAAAIPVLLFSFFCLFAGILLISMLIITKEKLSYVSLLALSTTLTTLFSIMQQCNNIVNWEQGRVQYIEACLRAKDDPAKALNPLSQGFTAALYLIQYYFYGVDALLMMFWSMALVASVWLWRPRALQPYENMIGLTSKAAAFIIPAIFEGLRNLNLSYGAKFVVVNFPMLFSLTFSSICIVLILIKYVSSRLGLGGYATSTAPTSSDGLRPSHNRWARLSARVDPWLIVRFSIASILLIGFEAFIVSFCFRRYDNAVAIANMAVPTYTIHQSLIDIADYVPEPAPGLMIFFVFGTTAPFRARYAKMLGPLACFRSRNRGSPRPSPRIRSTQEWTRVSSEALRGDMQNNDIEMNMTDSHEMADIGSKRMDAPRVTVTGDDMSIDGKSDSISSEGLRPVYEVHIGKS